MRVRLDELTPVLAQAPSVGVQRPATTRMRLEDLTPIGDDIVTTTAASSSAPAGPPTERMSLADLAPLPDYVPRLSGPLPETPAQHEAIRRSFLETQHPILSRIPVVRDVLGGLTSAAASTAESATALGHLAGVVPDATLEAARRATSAVTPAVMSRGIVQDPAGTLGSAEWWASIGGQALGSMVALGGAGTLTEALTAARYAPAVVSAIAESATEAGSVYSDAIARGATPAEAGAAAAKTALLNLPLLAVSNVPVFEGAGRGLRDLATAAASEGTQEVAQQAISNAAARSYDPEQSLTEGMLESGLVGALAGAGAHAVVGRAAPEAEDAATETVDPADLTPVGAPAEPPITPRPSIGAQLAAIDQRAQQTIEAQQPPITPTATPTPAVPVEPPAPTRAAIPLPDGWNAVVGPTSTDDSGHTAEAQVDWANKRIVFANEAHLNNPSIRNHEIAHVLAETALPPAEQTALFDAYIAAKRDTPSWQQYGPDWIVKNHFHREEIAMDLGNYFDDPESVAPDLRSLFDRYFGDRAGRGPSAAPTDTMRPDDLTPVEGNAATLTADGSVPSPVEAARGAATAPGGPEPAGARAESVPAAAVGAPDGSGVDAGPAARGTHAIPAAHRERFTRLLDDARRAGFTGSDDALAERYLDALDEARTIARELDESDEQAGDSRDLLTTIARMGGLGIEAESAAGMRGELENLLESLNRHGGVVRRGARAGQRLPKGFRRSGGLPGLPGIIVRKGGVSLDTVREALQEDPRWADRFESVSDVLDAIDEAIRIETGTMQRPGARLADVDKILTQLLRVRPGEQWWLPPDEAATSFNPTEFEEAAPTETMRPEDLTPVEPSEADEASGDVQAEPVAAASGSPTRALYEPTAEGAYQGGRPISEQETVTRLQQIFHVARVTPGYVRHILGTARAAYPVRFGKVKRGAFGHYELQSGLIRLKRAFDLTTASHELGHMISYRIFGKTPPTGLFRQELLRLGEATTPPKKRNTRYHVEEGVAEYFRMWFARPDLAANEAPEFTRAVEAWLRAHPAADAQLHAAQAIVRRYLAQPAAVRGRARVNVRPHGTPAKVADVVAEATSQTGRAGARGFVRRFAQALKDTGNLPAAFRDPHRWWDTLLTHWVDRQTAVKRAVEDLSARGGAPDASEDAYVLTRLAAGTAGMAEGFLTHGPRGANGQWLGPSLQRVLQPIRHRLYPTADRQTPDFATYLVALRALELHAEGKGRWPGLTPDEARAIVREAHADPEAELFRQAAEGVYKYLQGLRSYAVEYEFLSPEVAAKLDEALFYVPLQRVRDEASDRLGGGAARIANRTSPIKRLKGSGRDIIDPIESIVKNTAALVSAVENNRAAVALVRQAVKAPHGADWIAKIPTPRVAATFNLSQLSKQITAGLAAQGIQLPGTNPSALQVLTGAMTGGSAPTTPSVFDQVVTAFLPATFGDPSQRIITVVVKGTRQFFQIQDEALYQTLTAAGASATSETLRWAARPTSVLRAGATLRPSFIMRNLLRDTVGAMLQSRHGFVPIYDSIRGYLSLRRGDEDLQRFMAFGVQSSAFLGQDRDRIRTFIDRLTEPPGLGRKFRLVRHPLEALRLFSEQIEVATRLGEFKLALDNPGGDRRAGVLGILQRLHDRGGARPPVTESRLTRAALAARDVTVDFGRGGDTAKQISQFKAFFNARVQGYVRIGETIARDPIGSALTVGALAALSAALWALNHDDDEYQEIPAQQRRDYWFIKLPGNDYFITIPKPFEWAIVPNLLEAAFDETLDTADVLGIASPADVVLQLTPTALLPFLEALTNWDTFRRRPIVSPWDTHKDPDLQVREWTSDTARALAAPFGMSPAVLEHVAYGLGGGLARDITALTDPVARLLTGRDRPPSPAVPITQQIPGLGAVARPSAIGSSSQSLQDFYEAYDAYEGAAASLRDRLQGEGLKDPQRAQQRFAQTYPPETVERLKAGKRRIDELRESLAAIRGARDLTPPDKLTQERTILAAMADVARRALGRRPLRERTAR